MKKSLAFILSLVLCIGFSFSFSILAPDNDLSANNFTSTVFDTDKMTMEELEFYKKSIAQYDAVIVYDELIGSFIDQYGNKDGLPANYPENYAGAYINDHGKLVIQISNTNNQSITYAKLLNEYSSHIDLNEIKERDATFVAESIENVVEFEQVVYSLNELNVMMTDTINYLNNRFSTLGYYVNTLNNTITIIINKDEIEKAINTLEIDNDFKSVVGYKIPLVFESGEISEPSLNHMGGQGYYNHGSAGGLTLGFTGWYNGIRAYLTCGHSSAFNAGDTAKYNSTTIGTVTVKQWANNGSGDWAIINLNSSQTISGLVKQNYSGTIVGKIKARVNSVPINTIVYRFGNTSQVWSTLKVNAVGVSKAWFDTPSNSNYTINGLVRCTLQIGSAIQDGDSGGPFVISNGNDYSAVGTTTGEASSNAYYSPLSHVPTNFAVEIGY